MSTYSNARKKLSLPQALRTRQAIHAGVGLGDICAAVPVEDVHHIEAVVDEAVAHMQAIAKDKLGFSGTIAIRRDWTVRTFKAKLTRSRGGLYTEWFRNLDEEVPHEAEGRDAAVSLRLAREWQLQEMRKWHGLPTVFAEYDFIAAHPLIGARGDISFEEKLQFLVAHECAHAIDFSLSHEQRLESGYEWQVSGNARMDARQCNKPAQFKGKVIHLGGHGSSWQSIYATLRNESGLNSLGRALSRVEMYELLGFEVDGATGRKKNTAGKTKTCANCGEEFKTSRKDAMFCSTKCRTAHHRKKPLAAE